MRDDPFTPAEAGATMHAGLWALPAPRDGDYDMARAVLDAVAPLIAARVQAERVAAIVAHADEHAPADGNEAQRRVRWHLHIAARVAAGPMTAAEAAAAFKDAITHTHRAGEDPR